MINNRKVIGIICECNPYHAGHTRLIKEASKRGDIIVAVMSGNYVQRGEPSVYNKHERCRKLLSHNVDMVIEIPIEYTLSSAKYFARCSVSILENLSFVDEIIFGSKINDVDRLKEYACINLNKGNIDIDKKIENLLKKGLSYSKIISEIYGYSLSPNDILAVEYIRALKEMKSKITPVSIKRKNDLKTASELRKNIKAKITCDSFSDILKYKIYDAKEKNKDFSHIQGINNELSNAILNTAYKNISFDKRAKLLNTKNRTLASIKRAFFNIIFDIDKKSIKNQNYGFNLPYIHILGIKKEAMPLLKFIKVPYLLSYANSSYKDFYKKYNKNILNNDMLIKNVYASNIYYFLALENIIEASVPCAFF